MCLLVCQNFIYLSCTRCCWAPASMVIDYYFSRGIPIFSNRKVIWQTFFLDSVFLIMLPITATTTIQPLTVVCSRASLITMTVTMAPTSVHLTASDQLDLVLPPQLLHRDTMRGSFGLTTVPKQQLPQSEMPSQAYASYTMGPSLVSFLFQRWASHQFFMLYVGACYDICFLLSGSHVTAILINRSSTLGVWNAMMLLTIPLAGIYVSCWWSVAHARCA